MSKKKIMVFVIPMSGHINPIWPVLKELIKTGDYEVSVFMDEKNKSKVENLGAIFKPIINNFESFMEIHKPNADSHSSTFLESFYDIINDNLEFVCSEIDKTQPCLIIYDMLCMHFKWIAGYYTHYYNLSKKLSPKEAEKLKFSPKNPFPKIVCLSTTIAFEKFFPSNEKLENLLKNLLGFELKNFQKYECLDLAEKTFVCILPDLQQNIDTFDQKKYRFLGSTVNANFSDLAAKEEPFKTLLEKNDFKLIYAALGTVFNHSVIIYKTIIETFKNFDQEPEDSRHPSIRLNNLKVIVSLGEYVYNEINVMIKNGTFEVPDNIILVKYAPQIDILKKASLFISHGGMNSTSESIHFGGKIFW